VNDKSNNSASIWGTGRLLPRLMLLYFILDIALRFVPLDPLTFRAWEAMLRRYPNAVGPFTPSKHYHRDNSYGGVANIGNLPAERRYRTVDFTTDAFGFHNPPSPIQTDSIGIVVGDSFAVGSELPEHETLSAQLSRRFGGYFYNAGAPQPLHLSSLRAAAQRIGLHRGLVIYEFLEARAWQDPPATTPEGAQGAGQRFIFRTLGQEWIDRFSTPINQLHSSPLQAISAKLEKKLQDNTLLPNSFAGFVIQEKLRNGDSILFLPAEFKTPDDPRSAAARWGAYLAWYSNELRESGLGLLVLVVPNRSTIYSPLLAQPRDVSASLSALGSLAQAFQNAGVRAVSLQNRYAQEAATHLNEKKYLYLLDDTHWNGNGTAIAAEEIFNHRNE